MCSDDELIEALASLDVVEFPRPSSQVEPQFYPLDEIAVARTWGGSEAATATTATDTCNGVEGSLADILLRNFIAASFRDEQNKLEWYLRQVVKVSGVVIAERALSCVLENGFERPLYYLCARAFVAAFLKLKLEGVLPEAVTFVAALESNCVEIRRRAILDYPRIRPRAKRLALLTARSMRFLIQRLADDQTAIAGVLGVTGDLRTVNDISFLGDIHGVGGQVTRLTLSGRHAQSYLVVYKPRSLDVDDAFYELADELARQDDESLVRPWILRRGQYGWMQHIDPHECETRLNVSSFYSRLGWFTALLYALSGRDCHAGNVVACGEYPVLVDLECLLTPGGLAGSAGVSIPDLVTSTAVIPMVRFAIGDFPGMDVSAFSGGYGGQHFYRNWYIANGASSIPMAGRHSAPATLGANVPRINGMRVDPFEFSDSFVAGFKKGYRCLLRTRVMLLAPEGGIKRFESVETRYVIRNTGEYIKAINESTAPVLLTSKIAELEHYRCFLGRRMLGVVDAEIRQLWVGWIPRFGIISDVLHDGGLLDRAGLIGGFSGLERVRRFLESNLSEDDLDQQVRLIGHCIGAMALNRRVRRGALVPPAASASSPVELLQCVLMSLEKRRRSSYLPDWLSYETSRAGTLVVARAHWGGFTGKASIVGTYLQLEGLDWREAVSTTLLDSMTYLSNHQNVVGSLPVEGVDGQASFVLLDALAQRTGRTALSVHRMCALSAISSATSVKNGGLTGMAGTLLLLAAAQRVHADPSVQAALALRMTAAANSEIFRTIENALGRRRELDVSWTTPWTLLLAMARAGRINGNGLGAELCAKVISHPGLVARTAQARLLRVLLLLECGASSTHVLLQAEIRALIDELDGASIASQYGNGALLGIICSMAEKNMLDPQLIAKFSEKYASRVAALTKRDAQLTVPSCRSCDVARGIAGVALRIAQVCAKHPAPAMVIF